MAESRSPCFFAMPSVYWSQNRGGVGPPSRNLRLETAIWYFWLPGPAVGRCPGGFRVFLGRHRGGQPACGGPQFLRSGSCGPAHGSSQPDTCPHPNTAAISGDGRGHHHSRRSRLVQPAVAGRHAIHGAFFSGWAGPSGKLCQWESGPCHL